jgi:hypothetical protein
MLRRYSAVEMPIAVGMAGLRQRRRPEAGAVQIAYRFRCLRVEIPAVNRGIGPGEESWQFHNAPVGRQRGGTGEGPGSGCPRLVIALLQSIDVDTAKRRVVPEGVT